ncbi:MAG TPA: LOG family protein [Aggregatilineales bacterium]|nr:LOG family protein [Chloroflexota bacterium]HOA22773.1 LOG family protein [Aggregatilineales bacterium]HPV06952.1 LOG family protein [Aggregatilineales bacterium]HQA68055.1 LOG family protein [Aggregatilineales bacterium]HQE19246.1 LOG family protein [Aggregatilineales bacterium]
MTRTVSVYGGGSPKPGEPAYQQAYELGKLLAEAGYIVMTGGYSGTMEATSRGAKEAGGYVIGVTVGLFERAGLSPNPYIDEIIQYDELSERLLHVVKRGDAAIALPGGIGTLSEVALTWSLLQTGEISPRPFILLGEQWADLLHTLYGWGAYIRDTDMSLWQIARTPEQAVTLLRNWE